MVAVGSGRTTSFTFTTSVWEAFPERTKSERVTLEWGRTSTSTAGIDASGPKEAQEVGAAWPTPFEQLAGVMPVKVKRKALG